MIQETQDLATGEGMSQDTEIGKKLYTYLDDDGRILSVTNVDFHDGSIEYEYPKDFDVMSIGDYRIVDGVLEYTGEATAAREEAEKKVQSEAERRQVIDEGCQAFFIDGGKAEMEQAVKVAASSGGAVSQLKALASLQVSTISFDATPCDTVAQFIDLWPDWRPDTKYKHNDPLTHDGRKFRASKDLTSQAIYPPGSAESEYYEVRLAADGIIIWYQPGGEYNQVYKGERRHYPDENGPVYEALENTTYAPDAYPQHWRLIGNADTEYASAYRRSVLGRGDANMAKAT